MYELVFVLGSLAIFCYIYQIGVKDHLTGQYIIRLPSRSRTVYYKGTKIQYIHTNKEESISLDGPTNVPFRVVVSITIIALSE